MLSVLLTDILHFASFFAKQVRNALSDEVKKEGIDDNPQSVFTFLIDRVRANLHVVLCMSPVGEAFRLVSSACCKSIALFRAKVF